MGPGDALHHPPDSLIVRGVLVAVDLVDRSQYGPVEPDGGDEGKGGRHGQGSAGLGSDLEGVPGGGVTPPRMVGEPWVQGAAPLSKVCRSEARRWAQVRDFFRILSDDGREFFIVILVLPDVCHKPSKSPDHPMPSIRYPAAQPGFQAHNPSPGYL